MFIFHVFQDFFLLSVNVFAFGLKTILHRHVQAKFKHKMLSCVFPDRFYAHVYSLTSLDVLAEN